MFLFDTNYPCALSNVTFGSIVTSLNADPHPGLRNENSYIAFIDGDSSNILCTVKQIYEQRKRNKVIYVITLLSKGRACSSVVKHFSDFIVDKKITYDDLKNLVRVMSASEPKVLEDNILGNIWGEILNSSQNERLVLQLLVEGYSQSYIAKRLNLSIKTISGYKVKAVKRHGARSFNELYILRFSNDFQYMK